MGTRKIVKSKKMPTLGLNSILLFSWKWYLILRRNLILSFLWYVLNHYNSQRYNSDGGTRDRDEPPLRSSTAVVTSVSIFLEVTSTRSKFSSLDFSDTELRPHDLEQE